MSSNNNTTSDDNKNGTSDAELTRIDLKIKTNDKNNYKMLQNSSNMSLNSSYRSMSYIPHQTNSDYVEPLRNIEIAIIIGAKKAESTSLKSPINIQSIFSVILKSMMSGSYLGFSITLSIYAVSIGWDKISAALLFPTGFVMLMLMGNDLATGNFCLLPMAYLAGKRKLISIGMILINWTVVYLGNFLGALTYLFFMWGAITHFGQRNITKYEMFVNVLCNITETKILGYVETGGAAGWFAAMFNGILCNWMVTMAVLLSFSSKSTIGKVVAMYIPIAIFITLGFEHSIVNLFLLPAGFAFECNSYSVAQWLLWNQIPVTLGNIFAGILLTGAMYYVIWSGKLRIKYENGVDYQNVSNII
eukprot:150299_1